MSKALVIKGADFSANKVETITFDVDIPCTGVSFASSTVSVSKLGVVNIAYTLTPSNTTDTAVFTSSDTSVINVSGSTITAVGLGTAALTLSCGSHTATCTVTVSVVEEPVYIVGFDSIVEQAKSGEEHDGICVAQASNKVFCVGDFTDGYFSKELQNISTFVADSGQVTAIKIPMNANKIHVEATNVYNSAENCYVRFIDADTEFTYNARNYLPILSSVELTRTSSNGVWSINQDVDIPSGATGYIVQIRASSSSVLAGGTTEAALKTIAEETMGISISYLTA